MISLKNLDQRLLKLEGVRDGYTHQQFAEAYTHALDCGELPDGPPAMRKLITDLINSLAAIEEIQVGTTREEFERQLGWPDKNLTHKNEPENAQ